MNTIQGKHNDNITYSTPHASRWIALGAFAAATTFALAQDSGPIDFRTYDNGSDASNFVGSDGRNLPVYQEGYQPNSANLYVTGNVTGGRSFQAFSPVRDVNSLGLRLPSAAINDFERDSVGLDDALNGRTPAYTVPYYARQSTATNLPTLNAGYFNYEFAPTQTLYNVPLGTQNPSLYGTNGPLPGAGIPGQLTLPSADSFDALQTQVTGYAHPTLSTGTLFGATMPDATGNYGIDPSGTLPTANPYTATSALGIPPLPSTFATEWVNRTTNATGIAADSLLNREPLTGRMILPDFGPEKPQPAEIGQTPSTVDSPAREALADLNVDVFGNTPAEEGLPRFVPKGDFVLEDMVSAMQFMEEINAKSAEINASLSEKPTLRGQYLDSVNAARSIVDEPIRSFAGTAGTPVERYLRDGERLLREGEYYQAKLMYERGQVLDRRNPLLMLGQGHAMLAAGEYYSAALRISRAIEMFPEIASFKFDLRTFIVEENLLEKRRADLERRLAEKDDVRFRFVLGYMEYYGGLPDYGMENLRKAAASAQPGSGIAQFAQLLDDAKESPQTP